MAAPPDTRVGHPPGRGKREAAGTHYDRALALNPNYVWTYCAKGFFLTISGRLEEGIACDTYALRQNPLMPNPCLYSTGFAHFSAKRYGEALANLGKMSNTPIEIQGFIAAYYAQPGRDGEASAAAAESLDRAETEFAVHPGDDVELWQGHLIRLMSLDDPFGREHLFSSLRKANLPL